MRRNWLIVLGAALGVAILSLASCRPGNTSVGTLNFNSQQEGIWVSGQGKVTAAPDIATLRLGIEAQESSVSGAQQQAAAAMDKVMTALTKNGVAKKDIQTQYFNITKVTRWDDKNQREVIIGYRVSNIVTAKIRALDKAGATVDAAAQAGGELTRIDSISFAIDDPSAYQNQAREKAMADAKAKAEQIAKLAGVTVGQPTYISESAYFPAPIPFNLAEKRLATTAVETPISPGEMEISVSVQVTYAILK